MPSFEALVLGAEVSLTLIFLFIGRLAQERIYRTLDDKKCANLWVDFARTSARQING
jgi:hypothetical protein